LPRHGAIPGNRPVALQPNRLSLSDFRRQPDFPSKPDFTMIAVMRLLAAEFLLIDIGNTNAKLRLASAKRLLGRTRSLPTADLLGVGAPNRLRRLMAGWRFDGVVLASVVPAAAEAVERLLGKTPVLRIGSGLDVGVDLSDYPGRRTLGADRLADMAGAIALHGPGPLIVADLGTAAVFNAIDAPGSFLGGVIAPGLAALHGSLPAQAAQLPLTPLRARTRVIGRNTREALLAGTLYGHRGLLREILSALRDELPGARLIATGGGARLLKHLLTPGDVIDPHLTLQGLRVIAVRHRR
jgi:type III pantothenate kinase